MEKLIRKFNKASKEKLADLRKYEAYEKPSEKRRRKFKAAQMRERTRDDS